MYRILLAIITALLLTSGTAMAQEYDLFVSPPADNGVRYIQIDFDNWPRVVLGVAEDDAVLEEYVIDLPESWIFYAGGSFIGLDRGDVGEFDLRIACDGGPMIYQRSLHKETATAFNSEDWEYAVLPRCDRIRIWIGARTTGPNDILRPGQTATSRPDFGARLWTAPDYLYEGGQTEEEPPDDPPVENGADPADYVHLDRADFLLDPTNGQGFPVLMTRLTWGGARHLLTVADSCPFLFDSMFDTYSSLEFHNRASVGVALNQEGQRISDRLPEVNRRCEESEPFCSRSNVRKSVVANWMDRTRAHLAITTEIASALDGHPELGRSFDNLAGYCHWCLEDQNRCIEG